MTRYKEITHVVKDREDLYRVVAKKNHHIDGEIEIDTDAKVSLSENGAYVQAWIWIDAEELIE